MFVPTRRQWDYHLLLGVLFICLSGLTSPVMNGFAKLLGETYSSLQISWARAFGHILFMLAVFVPRVGLRMLRTHRLGSHLTRSGCLFTSNLAYFFAIGSIPIADAASINMIGPHRRDAGLADAARADEPRTGGRRADPLSRRAGHHPAGL
jgi:threonine/homoserine efflux transporter RhtA